MKSLAFGLAVVLASTMVEAKELVVTLEGEKVTMECTLIKHEIQPTDRDQGSQSSAMACSFLFYNLLAKDDIPGAAQLSTNPAKTLAKWTQYRERVGSESFKKSMEGYFTSRNVVLVEIVLAEDSLLVVQTEDGFLGQFYLKKGGKYFMTNQPATGETLGKVLTMIQEGKIKWE